MFTDIKELEAVQTIQGFDLYDLEELAIVGLADLCEYTTKLSRRCRVMRDIWEDGTFSIDDEIYRENLDDVNGHLILVADILAGRVVREV